MKRFLLLPLLAVTTLACFGCGSNNNGGVRASVPGGAYSAQSATADAEGTFALYRVMHFDKLGVPLDAEKIASVNLHSSDRLGFDYVVPSDKKWDADTHSDVVAYAGSFRQNLGPILTINEKYFWCNPNEWDGYWSGQPARVLESRFTFH